MENCQREAGGYFEAARGRLRLALKADRIGGDLVVFITGGATHIGAVALASGARLQMFELTHHREGKMAARAAQRLAGELQCTAAVLCGIHYERISREEIGAVYELAENLTGRCAAYFKKEKIMLAMADLEKFENALKSGQIEDQFKYGDEKERGEILELLEKIMDVAELADEVATRIIFRGLNAPGTPQKG